ncbi:MAG: hypothetical protein H0T43_07770 [Solirubrobacterales bacterium]|nr:hypothetical protein [Solirubrobacterales bacterium]
MSSIASKPASVRVRQAGAFAAGAIALALLAADPADFRRTPLLIGLAYLAAASLGGRRGGHWSTACVLIGWGLAVVLVGEGIIETGDAPAYLAGAGAGALVAAGLERAGFSADLLGVAAAMLLAGLLFGLSPDVAALEQGETYAAALAVVAVVNLALALRAGAPPDPPCRS